jgi:hypothetical protein
MTEQNTSIEVVAGGGPADFLTVRHLRASGTNREIGRALAAAASEAHGDLVRPRPVTAGNDRIVQRARRRWFEQHYGAFSERMRGIADVFGVPAHSDAWDCGWLATYDGTPGCSTAFYPATGTKEGHGLLSRNFDFPDFTFGQLFGGDVDAPARPGERPLAADPWIVELHPDDGYASIAIGIMDVMGAMDGVNEAGLAVALMADNESPGQEPTGTPQVGLAEQQIVRYLLDTCATVDDAKQALLLAKQYYRFVPCHYLVADRSGRAFVWEYAPGHNQEHIVDNDTDGTAGASGRLVCTNHLLHRWPTGSRLPVDTGADGTAALTYSRWTRLTDLIGAGAVVDRDDIRAQFRAVRFEAPVEHARTFWHGIYDVDEPSVELSFFLRDEDGRSRFSDPRRFALGEGLRPARPWRRAS